MILIIIGAKNPAQSSFNEQANSSKILRGTLYMCVCVEGISAKSFVSQLVLFGVSNRSVHDSKHFTLL